ncbi:MAG: aminotransferase class V-fold PLP-dependent enzyme [Nitrososphaeria archaeon]
MIPYFVSKAYGNPTITHRLGWLAYDEIVKASKKVAEYIGAESGETINFTPCETEANNLAIVGSFLSNKGKGSKVVISEIEPLSVVYATEILKGLGAKVVKVPVDGEGILRLGKLSDAVDGGMVLVSIMAVNNEIGSVQDVKGVVEVVKDKNPNVLVQTDASAAVSAGASFIPSPTIATTFLPFFKSLTTFAFSPGMTSA